MSTYAPPDDVRFPFNLLFPVLEGCPPVVGPSHLEDARRTLDALDSETLSESPVRLEILNHLLGGKLEAVLFFQ